MTEQELRHWTERELRRRLEEEADGRTERLAPPDAFSDTYAPENPDVQGPRGRESSTVEGLLGGGCCGWTRRPDAAELYDAMQADQPTERQMAVASALIGEAEIDDLLMAHLEGAFTWRQLAAMIHRLGIETTELSTYLNNWITDTESDKRTPNRERRENRKPVMKLSETAAKTWWNHRDALRRIAGDASEPGRLLLGGGSMLNAEWGHRESIDIHMLLPERRSVNDLAPGKRLDLGVAVGGKVIRQTRYRITATTPEGVLDITAMKPELYGCEREVEIEGSTETVLSTAQILRGKLARIRKALPRDAFDLITAARADPGALEIAVNALSKGQRVTAREHLRKSNATIAANASHTLTGVPDHYRTPPETMGLDAANTLRQHEYTRVQIFKTKDGITVLTVARHGTPRVRTASEDARTALRDTGISEYLDANSTASSYEVEKALDALTRRREEGLVLDTDDDDPAERCRSALSRASGHPTPKRADDHGKNVVRGHDQAVGGGKRAGNKTL